MVLSTSCSLLHVPFTTANEEFAPEILAHFAFAAEKLDELRELDAIRAGQGEEFLAANKALFAAERTVRNAELATQLAGLDDAAFTRQPALAERAKAQHQAFNLPVLPTTTIGSFPQTREIKVNSVDRKSVV